MKTFKTRHQFYLPEALSKKIDALAEKPGASKTSILTDALEAWLDREGSSDLDTRFGPRLDRTRRAMERIDRKLDFLTEMLGVFVQHQLTIAAREAPFDEEIGQLGLARYRKYMDLVERRLTKQTASKSTTISDDSTEFPGDEPCSTKH